MQQVGWYQRHAEWKMPASKGHMLYVSIYVTFFKWQN